MHVRPKIIGDIDGVGIVDVVFLAVKAHGLPEVAPRLGPLLGPNTIIVSTQNGVPWWFFDVPGEPYSGLRLDSIDPGGVIARSIDSRRVLGSIVYFATEIVEPGVIRHIEGNRMSIGEPDGARSERARAVAELLVAAGLRGSRHHAPSP